MTRKPTVLFVCVRNAGRSQMAAGWLQYLTGDEIEIWSAGSEPAHQINPLAVESMREVGIDISRETPKILTTDSVSRAEVVITMGCGDTCPYFPGKRYEDWDLTDPAGQPIDVVRRVRDDIEARVTALAADLLESHRRASTASTDTPSPPRCPRLIASIRQGLDGSDGRALTGRCTQVPPSARRLARSRRGVRLCSRVRTARAKDGLLAAVNATKGR